MPLVKVKEKFQVTLPAEVRKKIGLSVGDVLQAEVANGKITLSPKNLIDRRLAEALDQIKRGKYIGPFETAEEAIRALHARAKRRRAR